MSRCLRPKGLCCLASCDHPPECDHQGYGTEETTWGRKFCAGEVVREYPGGIFCKRCGWWLRESPRPADWPPVGAGSTPTEEQP